MWVIESEGVEWTVPEELFEELEELGLIESCDECSSEFSARMVAHPANEEAEDLVRDRIKRW